MKVIDLLIKIANGEELPKKVKYKKHIYTFQFKQTKEENIANYYYSDTACHHLIDGNYHDIRLNDEIEIIEEPKKIEKLDIKSDEATPNCFYIVNNNGIKCYMTKHSKVIADKLNEIIDYINRGNNDEQ